MVNKLKIRLGGFEEALLYKPLEIIQGQIFSEMIRVRAQKSELQAKSQSYSWAGPPESEPNRPERGPEWGLGASTENPPESLLKST